MRRSPLFSLAALGALLPMPMPLPLAAQTDYHPAQQLTGEIRLWGSPSMLPLMKLWEEGFRRYQPNIVFQNNLKSTASAQFGLFESVADLAVSARHLYPYEYYGVYRRSLLYPVEITVATGATEAVGKSTALAIVVNRANPLDHVSLAQLDGIFGTARTGGWQDLVWADSAARGPEKNLRTWDQLGVKGALAGQPIHPYGPPGIYPGGQTFFQQTVLGGGDMFAESLREYQDRHAMLQALVEDPQGIAYVALGNATPEQRGRLRVLSVSRGEAGPFIPLSRSTVTDHSYPLARFAYLYYAPDGPGGVARTIDPKLKEFLTYVLSPEGQQQAAREGDYLPLTPDTATAQRARLK